MLRGRSVGMIIDVKFLETNTVIVADFNESVTVLDIDFSDTNSLLDVEFGELSQVTLVENQDVYVGDYVVTPEVESKTLPTANHIMLQDMMIKAIPFYDVGNLSGGSTVYIGKELD